MAAYENDQGPYRGHQPRIFDSGQLAAPVRGAAPLTSTFDQAPVRVVGPPTSAFDTAPVRGDWASVPAVTTQLEERPVTRAAAPTAPLRSRFVEPAVAPGERPVASELDKGQAPLRRQTDDSNGAAPLGPMATNASFWPAVANVLLRALTCLCLIIALPLLARYISLTREVAATIIEGLLSDSLASPRYALGTTIVGLIYSLFQLTSAILYLAMGKSKLPTKVLDLISYIGDQVFMVLFLSNGSAIASYLTIMKCSNNNPCGKGAAAAVMEFLAFAFVATNSVLSTFFFYMKGT